MTTIDTVRELEPEWPMTTVSAQPWTKAAPRSSSPSAKPSLDRAATAFTVGEGEVPLDVIGSTNIYDEDGKIRLIPVRRPPREVHCSGG